MPMHDWTRVEAGIFQAFHHDWITEIARALNGGLLSPEYYALAEQQAAGFGPDVLTLQTPAEDIEISQAGSVGMKVRTRPKTQFTAELPDSEFYRRKKSSIAIRHVSGDRMVALLEIVSPGNKSSRNAMQAFVAKACEFLEHRIHMLIVDIEPIAVGDELPEMPLFVEPESHILVPLERTYQASFAGIPQRWRRVLEAK